MKTSTVTPNSSLFKQHKKVIKIQDEQSGLLGFIAIHNDNLGPAVGGTRMFPYGSEDAALTDVLKLSEAMTYKCALAGVPHGGGKGVIIGDPKVVKSKELLHAYALAVDSLNGAFHTGEDVGISEADVQYMLQYSENFIGREDYAKDPSPYAALSTFIALKEAVKFTLGKDSLEGVKVSVKGLGKVGGSLVELLEKEKATIIATDIDPDSIKKYKDLFPSLQIVSPLEIFSVPADVYAPCAMGDEFSLENIHNLQVKIICGAANNQLHTKDVGKLLFDRDIVYVPDYIANAGGLIDVVDELEADGYNKDRVNSRIEQIKNMVTQVLTLSRKNHIPESLVADKMAEDIFLQTN